MDYKVLFYVLIGIIGFLLVSGIIVGVIIMWYVSGRVFKGTAIKYKHHTWERKCSDPDDYEMHTMWDQGLAWEKENRKYKEEVKIVTKEGLNLFGEYFNYGSDKTVILIGGRLESLMYSYYFAETFKKANFNILCIDKRGHGLSTGGEVEDFGQVGWVDILEWARFLNEKYNCNDITIHGVCIGGTAGIYALTSKDCPSYIKRLIVDGQYSTLYDNFYHHLKEQQRPTFLLVSFIMKRLKKIHKQDYIKDGPLYRVKDLKVPTLFIYSKEDVYAPQKDALRVFEACGAKDKKMATFPVGRHSHVRFNNLEEYDQTILNFLKEYENI